ncbi:hypothetical protein [Tateyamaria sp.]|uniref:hypothetical protein n=1 Tax=Tateyamaria sp. TaxID=1929288 RepID=UPI00329FF58C
MQNPEPDRSDEQVNALEQIYPHYPLWMKLKTIWCVAKRGTKVPLMAGTLDECASSKDPSTWSTFEAVKEHVDAFRGFAIGYMHDGTFSTIDLDDTNADNFRSRCHEQIFGLLPDHWRSISISGKGSHILIQHRLEGGRKLSNIGLEVYGTDRFMLETFNGSGEALPDNGQLAAIWATLEKHTENADLPNEPTEWTADQLIEKMQTFQNWGNVSDLWDNGTNSSEDEFRLFEFIWSAAVFNDVHSGDLVREVFDRSAAMTGARYDEKKRKRGGDRNVDKYLAITSVRAYRHVLHTQKDNEEKRQAAVQELFPVLFPPPKAANVVELISGQTTGYPDVDQKVAAVLQGVPQNSNLWLFVEWCNKRAVRLAKADQPVMALFGGIALIGIAASRRWKLENLMTTTAIVCVAPSASGKDTIAGAIQDALVEAGLEDYFGSRDVASGAAIKMDLSENHPVRLYMIDEFGDWVTRVESSDSTRVGPVIKEMVGRNIGYYTPKIQSTKKFKGIYSPAMSLVGMSTLQQMRPLLDEKYLSDGFLQRFTFVPAVTPKEHYPYVRGDVFEVPPNLVGFLRDLADVMETHGPDHIADVRPNLVSLSVDRDAYALLDQIADAKNSLTDKLIRESLDPTMTEALSTRLSEVSKRYGMILALSCGRANVTRADIEWGVAVGEMSMTYLNHMAKRAEASGDASSLDKRIARSMERLYDMRQYFTFPDEPDAIYVKHSVLVRQLGGTDARKAFIDMVREGLVETRKQKVGNAKKPTTFYKVELGRR